MLCTNLDKAKPFSFAITKTYRKKWHKLFLLTALAVMLEPHITFAAPATAIAPTEVAFIDTAVAGWETLRDGMKDGVDVVLIDSSKDGLMQMATWAESHSGYDAIHIISHGKEGRLLLGTTNLNAQSVANYSEALQQIGASLNADGDILIYGCDIDRDARGAALLALIANTTGADVAASKDATGAATAGGNAVLETNFGTITATSVVQLDTWESFDGVLAQSFSLGTVPLTDVNTSNINFMQVADVDNDGDIDILTQAGGANSDVTLWTNNGSGSFTSSIAITGVTGLNISAAGAKFADFDNDGDVDFYQWVSGGSNDLFYANNGSGIFSSGTVPLTDFNTSNINFIQIGDVDLDGDIDILTQTGGSAGDVTLWTNNGSGSFTSAVVITGVAGLNISAAGAKLADFDNDGDLDYYQWVTGASNDIYYTNNGSGAFSSGTVPLTDFNTSNINFMQVADIDNDGDMDILTQTGGSATAVTLWTNDGSGGFTSSAAIATGVTGLNISAVGARFADYDNDGDLDYYQWVSGATNDLFYANDNAPPRLTSFTPLANGTANATDNLVLTFSHNSTLSKGTGTVSIRIDNSDGNYANDTIFEAFSVADARVSLSGNSTASTVTINPNGNFVSGVNYYVVIAPTAFVDTDGKGFVTKVSDRFHAGLPDPAVKRAGNSLDTLADRTVMSFTGANSPPVITNVNSDSVAWAGVGNTVTLDLSGNGTVSDAELGALNSGNGNWSGGSLAIQRSGTAVSSDVLGFNTTGALFTVSGANLQASGLTFATFTNAGGILTITFTSSGTTATTALVQDVLRHITYRNDTPAGDATVRFTLSDGTATTTADVTVTSDTIYITNTTDTATIDVSNGVSFSEAVAIAAADVTGSQTLIFTSSFTNSFTLAGNLSINESLTIDADAASGTTIATNTITIASGQTVTFTNGTSDTFTIGSTLSGAGGLTKTGAGTLVFTSTSNSTGWSGGLNISGGVLQANGDGTTNPDSRLATGTITIDGGTLRSQITGASSSQTIDNAITLGASGGTFDILGGSGLNTIVLSGVISGSGNLTKMGASKLSLTGNNDYTGTTITSASGGTLIAGHNNALGSTGSGTTVSAGTTLDIASGITLAAEPLSITGTGAAPGGTPVLQGALRVSSGSATVTGNVTLSGNSTIDIVGTGLTVSGGISGGNTLTKNGSGTLTLSGSNTYADTTVSVGTLSVSSDSNLGSGTVTLGSGTTLAVSGATTIDNAIALTGNATISNSANATISGVISGGSDLAKTGASTLTITATNTHTGAVTVSAGGLTISGGASIGDTSAVTVSSGATLTLGLGTETIGSLAGAGNVVLNYRLTTGGDNNSTTFSGVISGSGNGITKAGSGTFTLTGNNSYSGSTQINAGELTLNRIGGALNDNTSVTVASGATLTISQDDTIDTLLGAGTVALGNKVLTVGVNGSSSNFSGSISGTGTLIQDGTGTLTLSGTNNGQSWSTQVYDGTLSVGAASNLATGAVQLNNGTLAVTGNSTLTNAITVVGAGGAVSVTPGNTVNLAGRITGNAGFTKAGAGTAAIQYTSADNTTGTISVNAGTLQLDATAVGAVTVGAGATLSGNGGIIDGTLAVNAGGTLSPGVNSGIGILTTTSNLTIASGGTLAAEINGSVAGTSYDQVVVNGTVNVSGASLSVNHGYSAGQGDSYRIIDNDMADSITGTFSGLAEGATITAGGNSSVLTASYIGGTGNDFTLTAPINAAPVITNLNGDSVSFIEDSALVLLDANSDATVTDSDSPADFDGGNVTVSITANRVNTEDVLSIQNQGTAGGQIGTSGLNITYGGTIIGTRTANGGTGTNDLVITLNSAATPTITEALVRNLTYTNTNATVPNTTARIVRVTVNDGDGGTSSNANISVAVVAVNDAPTLTATGATPTFTEGGSAVALFSGTTIDTVEAGDLINSLIFTVANLANGSSEILAIDGTNVPLVSGSYTTATNALSVNVILVSSTATVTLGKVGGISPTVAQSVIDGITYLNNNTNPGIANRVATLTSIQDNGGTANGGADTSSLSIAATVSITPVNSLPVVTTTGSVTAFTEGNNVTSVPVVIDAGITVSDLDNATLASATVSITTGFQTAEDVLAFTNDGSTMGNISATYDSATGVLSLGSTGSSATLAEWQSALASITYTNTSESPNAATRQISVVVNDGTANSTASTKDVSVTPVNDAPFISGVPGVSVSQDAAYSFIPTASDVDSVGLVFSITNKPSWASFNTATGALTGTPTNADVGTTTGIVISVSDGTSSASLAAFNLVVTNVNDAPVISGTPATSVAQDAAYSFTPTASDVDVGDVLTFSITNKPSWASFNTATGALTGTPANADVGTTTSIVISVNDGTTTTSLAAFNLVVTNVNDAPVISGTPATSVAQGVAYSFTPTASDIDTGDLLTFSITNKPSWASFNTATGALTGTPANADVSTTTSIVISVSDGTVSASLAAFNLIVTNVNDAPLISGTPATSVAQDATYSFTPTASDVDAGDVLTFSITNKPGWASFNAATGALTGTPTNADVGTTTGIIISVSDGTLSASLAAFNLVVTNVNEVPVISGTPATSVAQGAAYSFTPTASDVDAGDVLIFSITNKPGWASFNATTGALTGTPTNADVGTTTGIVISVSDGTLSASLAAFNLVVSNVNDAPLISGTPATSVVQDATYSFTPTASDVDVGDVLTFSITNKPTWASFNATTGALTGTPTNADVGTTTGIIISVSDGTLSASLAAFNLVVTNVNGAPVISGTPATSVAQDAAYSFIPTASDVDAGDVLTFSITNKPTWASFNATTGALTGTPTNADVGTTTGIVISVSDGTLSASLAAFDLVVTNVNEAPVISGTPITSVNQDAAYSFTPTASDADAGDVLTFSITNKPTWASFNPVTGALTGTPTNADVGTTTGIVISVSDGTLSASLAAFDLVVTNVNEAPVISGTPITSVNQDVAYSFIPAASDVDVGDVLTFSITNKPTWASFNTATGALTGTPAGADSGVTTGIVISVSDGTVSASLPAFDLEVVSTVDPLQPIVTAPASIDVNATALFTPISLRQLLGLAANASQAQVDQALKALATDGVNGNNCCTVMAEGLQPGNVLLVRPGHHLLKWKATNAAGITGEASQVVNVKPLVSLSKSQVAIRGSNVEFRVLLNGPSPVYPLSIPYVIDASSTATTQEHNLVAGMATFTQPGQVEVVVPVSLAAVTGFSDSQLVVALGDGVNAGVSKRHVIDIREGNVPPVVVLSISQGGMNTSLITPTGGPVTVTATVADLNQADTHSFDWSATSGLADTDGNPTNATRVFNPTGLTGSHQVKVTVTDSGGASVQASAYFRVINSLPLLSPDMDTDGDGLSDALEGTGDTDDNGIPDYLDNMPSTNILPQQGNTTNAYLIECDPGVRCGIGLSARSSTSGGVQILDEELGSIPDIVTDKVFKAVGGIFDFAIRDLPTPGQTVRVVVPQRVAIPAKATYRKFQRGRWVSFVVDADNTIHSAAGNPGYCPPPGTDDWTPGLTAGHLCVQLMIKDGGPNDDDGLVNSAVVDPGAVSVEVEVPEPPEPPKPPVEIKTTGGGGGSIQALWVLLLGGLLMVKRVSGKGKVIAAALGVVTILASIATQAATGPYLRVDVANVSSSQREEDFTAALAAANYDLVVDRYDTNRSGYQLALGYQWNQHASTEIGYLDLGKVKVDLTVAGETDLDTIPWHIAQEYPLSAEGFTLVQGLTLNPNDGFRIIGEVGVFIWRSKVDVDNAVISIKRDRGEDPIVGVRFELPVQEQFGLGLGVRRIYFDTQEADLVSLTGTFRF